MLEVCAKTSLSRHGDNDTLTDGTDEHEDELPVDIEAEHEHESEQPLALLPKKHKSKPPGKK